MSWDNIEPNRNPCWIDPVHILDPRVHVSPHQRVQKQTAQKRRVLGSRTPRPHACVFVLKTQFFSFSKNIASIQSVFTSLLPTHTNTVYRFETAKKPDCACAAHWHWEPAKDAPSPERKKRDLLFAISFYKFSPFKIFWRCYCMLSKSSVGFQASSRIRYVIVFE